jgi:hypothetical protein
MHHPQLMLQKAAFQGSFFVFYACEKIIFPFCYIRRPRVLRRSSSFFTNFLHKTNIFSFSLKKVEKFTGIFPNYAV